MGINKLFNDMNKVARLLNKTAKEGRDIRDIANGDVDNLIKRNLKSGTLKTVSKVINKILK